MQDGQPLTVGHGDKTPGQPATGTGIAGESEERANRIGNSIQRQEGRRQQNPTGNERRRQVVHQHRPAWLMVNGQWKMIHEEKRNIVSAVFGNIVHLLWTIRHSLLTILHQPLTIPY